MQQALAGLHQGQRFAGPRRAQQQPPALLCGRQCGRECGADLKRRQGRVLVRRCTASNSATKACSRWARPASGSSVASNASLASRWVRMRWLPQRLTTASARRAPCASSTSVRWSAACSRASARWSLWVNAARAAGSARAADGLRTASAGPPSAGPWRGPPTCVRRSGCARPPALAAESVHACAEPTQRPASRAARQAPGWRTRPPRRLPALRQQVQRVQPAAQAA